MTDLKKLVFISHRSAEAPVAIALQKLIEPAFLNLIEVFVSSDDHSLDMGRSWVDGIKDALERCSVMLLICSPQSVTRPWLNFEAGAGWMRHVDVIPLCHSGMTISKLPLLFQLLHCGSATDEADLRRMLTRVAKTLGSGTPQPDVSPFIAQVREFENNYTFWSTLSEFLVVLESMYPGIVSQLSDMEPGTGCKIVVPQHQMSTVQQGMEWLIKHNLAFFNKTNEWVTLDGGAQGFGCVIRPLQTWRTIVTDPRCQAQ